ncbi:MAG: hypothetical protein AAGI91_06345 [Bacteroidota bacterium]
MLPLSSLCRAVALAAVLSVPALAQRDAAPAGGASVYTTREDFDVACGTAAVSGRAAVDNLSFGSEGPFRLILSARGSTTVAPGSSARLKYTVTNQTAQALEGGLFFYAERDSTTLLQGAILEGAFAPGQISRVYRQAVPRAARPGAYTYFLCIGPDIGARTACSAPLAVTVMGAGAE